MKITPKMRDEDRAEIVMMRRQTAKRHARQIKAARKVSRDLKEIGISFNMLAEQTFRR